MIMTGGKKASTFPLLQGLGIRRRFHSAGKLFSAMLHDNRQFIGSPSGSSTSFSQTRIAWELGPPGPNSYSQGTK